MLDMAVPAFFPTALSLRAVVAALLLALATPSLAQEDTLGNDFDDEEFFEFDEEDAGEAPDIADPLEGFNRAMFGFNDKAYRYVLKPVAKGLRILPVPVRTSFRNFFSNLGTPVSAISALLQGDLGNTGSEVGRFGVNTTLGILGLFDPATGMGLVQDDEDMGQTFGRWGVGTGPYIVLPLLGSSSLRDTVGFGTNAALNPINAKLDTSEIIALQLLRVEVALSLDQDTYEALYDGALDPYIFFRSAWTQNRAGNVAR